jgi:arylsulfatase A-like enzyme
MESQALREVRPVKQFSGNSSQSLRQIVTFLAVIAALTTRWPVYGTAGETPGPERPTASPPAGQVQTPAKPNIVYILCDDLGYGDVHCLNPQRGKIATPNLDRLASQGMTCTDAHSGSSVCTPTRYGILTGRYSWRSRLQRSVLNGDSPPLIARGRMTVASLLQQQGYTTACIGKWHLGMQFADKMFTKPIQDSPIHHGFDSYFGVSASLDMPPFVFIKDDRFTEVPTVEKKWIRKGPAAKDFEAIDVLPTLTQKSVEYIGSRATDAKAGKPFFLYLAFTSPHTPIVPTPQWQGKSGLGPYGDFVMETDWAVGQVLEALDRSGLAGNTMVVFTSDNGCSPAAGVPDLERQGHYPSAQFRGYKADIWDGGHRIPLLVRWPGKVKPASRSERLICLTDLMATCAEVLGVKLPDNAGEDSFSMLPVLLGHDNRATRESVIHHSISGMFAIRQGNWKLELCPGSGGWAKPRDPQAAKQGLPPVQLYDMAADVGEQTNQQQAHPEIVKRLVQLLEKNVADGRSTAGAPQKNDVAIDIWKAKRVLKDKAGKVIDHD